MEEDADVAQELATSGQEPHAPRLMTSEVADAPCCEARASETEPRAAGRRVLLTCVPYMTVPCAADKIVSADAVRPALTLDRPICDCVCLAHAHRIDAAMLTANLRFANALASTEHGKSVLTLANRARTR